MQKDFWNILPEILSPIIDTYNARYQCQVSIIGDNISGSMFQKSFCTRSLKTRVYEQHAITLVITGLGHEMFRKIHLVKFCPLFTYLKQSSFSFSKHDNLLGHSHGGRAILGTFFSPHSSACQILFFGLSTLRGCYKTFW